MSRYEFTSRVRYSETGPDGKMTLTAMMSRIQDTCVFHSEEVGRGPTMKRDSGWMFVSWQVLFREMPPFGAPVTTCTWGYRFKGVEADRNFTATGTDGRVYAEANARMVFFDRRTQRPIRVPADEMELYEVEDALTTFEYAPRRIPLPEMATEEDPIRVRPGDIDTNGHVNNIAYIEMAFPFLPEGFRVRELRVQYLQQARRGEWLIPSVERQEEEILVMLSHGDEDEEHALKRQEERVLKTPDPKRICAVVQFFGKCDET